MSHPYAAQIDITFPTHVQAENAMKVLQVDNEPGDRVVKSFSIVVTGGQSREASSVMRVYVFFVNTVLLS